MTVLISSVGGKEGYIMEGDDEGMEMRKRVEAILETLARKNLSKEERLKALSELKVLGRSPDNADPIVTVKGFKVLCVNAFETNDALARREAQRCLANALLLKPEKRKVFVEVGGLGKFVLSFKGSTNKRDADDDFLLGRIGFLLSAQKGEIVERLVNEDRILEDIKKILQSYLKNGPSFRLAPNYSTALTEILKFFYNLTFHVKVGKEIASPLITPLVQLLMSTPVREFQSPLTNVIHCFLNLPLGNSQSDLFPNGTPTKVVKHIIEILNRTVPEDTDAVSDTSLDESLSPVITLLSNIYEVAPDQVKEFMKEQLLPTESDRNLPIGHSQSLSSRLLRLVTNAFTPTLREAIFSLTFQLVNSSPSALVETIGYGYASGYLFSHNIPVPPNARAGEGRGDINPVTGQRLDAEPVPNISEMTDEEKEIEAERLFTLFERMRRLGVGVENPVRAAQQSGKFEELD